MTTETDKPLFLVLSKQWYDLIYKGIKKEEYRRICPHWDKVFWWRWPSKVTFQLGYQKNARRMTFKIRRGCRIDKRLLKDFSWEYIVKTFRIKAKPAWGCVPEMPQYVIVLGKRCEDL